MPSDYPTQLDTFPQQPALATETLADGPHSVYHDDLGDAVVALQAYVGIVGSGVAGSVTKRLDDLDTAVASLGTAVGVSITTSGFTNTAGPTNLQTWAAAVDAALTGGPGNPFAVINALGDLLVGSANDAVTRLPIGSLWTALRVDGTGVLGYGDIYEIPQRFGDITETNSFGVTVDHVGRIVVCHADDEAPRTIQLPDFATEEIEAGQSVTFIHDDDVPWEYVASGAATVTTEPGVDETEVLSAGGGSVVVALRRPGNVWHVFGGLRTASLNLDSRAYPAVRVSPSSITSLNTAFGYNTAPNTYNRVVIEESLPGTRRMWWVYVDKDRHVRLARRTLSTPGGSTASAWTEIDLSTKFTSGLTPKNSHCVPALHIDSDGYVHVIQGMLGGPIAGNYCVSRVPYSLTLGDYVPAEFESGAANDTVMTYCQFVACSDGSFVLLHRDSEGIAGGGAPGKTRFYVRRYIPNGTAPPASGANARWQTRVELIRGDGDPSGDRGPYVWQVATDPRDRATHYIPWCWRANATNFTERLACIVTHDDFATYELVDGTSVTAQLPLQTDNYTGAMVVDNVTPQDVATFVNHGGACVDWVPMDVADPASRGRPHIVYNKAVSGARTMHRAYWDGDAWVVNSTGAMGVQAARASIVATRLGGTYVLYTTAGSGRTGSARIMDTTPESDLRFVDAEVTRILPPGEIQVPQQPVLDFNEASFVVAQAPFLADDDVTSPDTNGYTLGVIVTLDADRLRDVAAGRSVPPRTISQGTLAVPGTIFEGTVTSAPTVVEVPSSSRLVAFSNGARIMARFVGVARVSGGATMSLQIQQRFYEGTTVMSGDNRVTSATDVAVQTTWQPLGLIEFLTSGEISLAAGIISGAGTGNVRGIIEVVTLPTEVYQ